MRAVKRTQLASVNNAKASELLREHDSLLKFLVRKHRLPPSGMSILENDDMMQVARIALVQSWVTFNGDRSSFRTWAYRCVSQALSGVRAEAHGKALRVVGGKRVWADSERRPPGGFTEQLDEHADEAPCEADDSEERLERSNASSYILSLLSGDERRVVEMWMDDRTFEEIGLELGVTRQRAQQIHADALRKARETMRTAQ